MVCRAGRVLLGRRLSSSHGNESWQFPGGHLEWFEEPEACAVREVREETGLELTNLRRGPFTNDCFVEEDRHYVTLFLMADAPVGDPEVREPSKCTEWRWCDWNAMPDPLFLPIRHLRAQGFVLPPAAR